MSMLRRLNLAQRVVLVVGIGLLFLAGGAWWYYGEIRSTYDGWFGYAPGTERTSSASYMLVSDAREPIFLVVPVVLIVVWTAISMWVLGLRPAEDDSAAP